MIISAVTRTLSSQIVPINVRDVKVEKWFSKEKNWFDWSMSMLWLSGIACAIALLYLFEILLTATPGSRWEIYLFVYVRFSSSSIVEWWRVSDVFGLTKSNAVAGSNTEASFFKRISFSSDRSSYTRRKHSTSPDSNHLLEMLPLSVAVLTCR